MNLKSFFGIFKGGSTKHQSTQNIIQKVLYPFLGNGVPFSMDNNSKSYVDQGFSGNVDVYSIVSTITRECANIPVILERIQGNEVEEIKDHPILDLYNNPNPLMKSRKEFIASEIGFKLIVGNTYMYSESPEFGVNAGMPTQVYVLPAQYIEAISGGWKNPIEGYRMNVGQAISIVLPKETVYHRKTFNPSGFNDGGGFIYGMSPLKPAIDVVTGTNNGYISKNSLAEKLGAIGILSTTDTTPLGSDQAKEIADNFRDQMTGAEKRGKIVFASAQINWTDIGQTAADLQLDESIVNNFKAMCDIYGIPIEIFARSTTSTFNNKQEARKQMIINLVKPELEDHQKGFNDFIAKHWNSNGVKYKIRAKWEDVPELQDDFEKKAKWVNSLEVATGHEKRQLMGLPPMDNYMLDGFLIAGNKRFVLSEDDLKALNQSKTTNTSE